MREEGMGRMGTMEKKLLKGGIYGFIIGLLIAILFVSDEFVYRSGALAGAVQYPMREYIVKLLRVASGFSLAAVAGVWFHEWMRRDKQEQEGPSFWGGFLKSFLIVLGCIIVLLLAASLWRKFV
ncbi:hypothetical protein ACFQ88_27910 [Paenibacillus sp. NPDC056579]|uniref:hypothetical protein n=1 Tax=Paenibacillus sp. NPDC056579 TaxID=3345871 RepID=UPI003687A946